MRSSSSRSNFQRQRSPQHSAAAAAASEHQNNEQRYTRQRFNGPNNNGDGDEKTEKFLAMQILQAILFTTRFVYGGSGRVN